MNMNPDRRSACFQPQFLLAALGCALVIIAAALVAREYPRGSAMRIALALVQGIATGVTILMPWWGMKRLDELQRRVQLEALAMAFFGTGILSCAYGFLESAGLPRIEWGPVIWPVMALLWAVGLVVANRRYR